MAIKFKSPFKREQEQEQGQVASSLIEQQMRRQSAPRPTLDDEVQRLRERQAAESIQEGAAYGFDVLTERIGREEVQKAQQTLNKYKTGKANLEQRIIDNEQWYKLRHWECMRKSSTQEVEPTSAWLFNCIANKHADAMDNFPSPNILPREEGDKEEAERLSSIIPVILDQNEFEETYSSAWDYKLIKGTGVYGVFWDKSKLGGLGDISIKQIDLLNLFWEPGIKDIQKSRNLFSVELCDNEALVENYPQLEGKLGAATMDVKAYIYDDTVDTTDKSVVVDWYYKKRRGNRTVLHYCKYVNDVVLYATENDPEYAERGWYDDGQYPFVFDPLFRTEGTPCGFGYIDIGKSAQEYIDRGNQAIMKNMLVNAKPRHFIRTDGGVNEEEYADTNKDFIHVDGSLGDDSIQPVKANTLNGIYVEVLNNKIDELKETTGNRDISTGGTTSGVTAASAIAAMQEAGSKLSRDNSKATYRAYRKIIVMVIERIRQFYNLPRQFRILGDDGAESFVRYSNAGIAPQSQGIEMGVDMGYRVPLFDIEITAQKQSPYSKMSQNELALQFYSAGFFNPQMADQALACLDMMDFDRKQFIMRKIAQNGGMYQQMLQMQQQMIMLAQIVDRETGTNLTDRVAAGITGAPAPAFIDVENPAGKASETEALGGGGKSTEPANTKQARERVANSTSPV